MANSPDEYISSEETDPDLIDLIEKVSAYVTSPQTNLIKKAYYYAQQKHKDQMRRSGEPYFVHPVAVAKLLTCLNLDEDGIIAGLLHDVVEDTDTSLNEIEQEFNPTVRIMVDGVTKLSKLNFVSKKEKLAENFRKMLLAMSKDIRVLIIKLADRTHNMQTLSHMKAEKQKIIAQETLDIYAPLANRLGIFWMKSDLEDLALRYLKPEIYYLLVSKINQKKEEREEYIQNIISIIEDKLKPLRFAFNVYGRPKHFYSIFKKMMHRNISFEDVTDLFAFRLTVNTISECYEVLGMIHSLWRPVPGRFKDYIAMPKLNNYRSLHTTVNGPMGEKIEIQIRTQAMHEICEHGIAAHWVYKENRTKINPTELESFKWLQQMVKWKDELADPDEFMESVKVDLFENVVYCFSPKGDVFELPVNSTPLDFAFNIHTDVGIRCAGAKVNNRIVPLRTRLKSGDTVEIKTLKNQKPTKDWLNFVVTSKARTKIRSILKQEEREQSRKVGKELLEKEFTKHKLSFDKYRNSATLKQGIKALKCNTIENLYARIGYGKIQTIDVVRTVVPQDQLKHLEEPLSVEDIVKPEKKKKDTTDIVVDGNNDILVKFGKCCHPLPGEDIVGFITRGKGITVHRANCGWAHAIDPDRKVNIVWSSSTQSKHLATIKIITVDKPGILANITKVISTMGINIIRAEVLSTDSGKGVLVFDVQVDDLKNLQDLVGNIENLSHVLTVQRLFK